MSQKNKPATQVGVAAAHYFFLEFAMPNKQSHVAKIQGHIEGGIPGFPIQQAQRTMSQKNKPTTQMGVAAANYFLLEFPASLCPHELRCSLRCGFKLLRKCLQQWVKAVVLHRRMTRLQCFCLHYQLRICGSKLCTHFLAWASRAKESKSQSRTLRCMHSFVELNTLLRHRHSFVELKTFETWKCTTEIERVSRQALVRSVRIPGRKMLQAAWVTWNELVFDARGNYRVRFAEKKALHWWRTRALRHTWDCWKDQYVMFVRLKHLSSRIIQRWTRHLLKQTMLRWSWKWERARVLRRMLCLAQRKLQNRFLQLWRESVVLSNRIKMLHIRSARLQSRIRHIEQLACFFGWANVARIATTQSQSISKILSRRHRRVAINSVVAWREAVDEKKCKGDQKRVSRQVQTKALHIADRNCMSAGISRWKAFVYDLAVTRKIDLRYCLRLIFFTLFIWRNSMGVCQYNHGLKHKVDCRFLLRVKYRALLTWRRAMYTCQYRHWIKNTVVKRRKKFQLGDFLSKWRWLRDIAKKELQKSNRLVALDKRLTCEYLWRLQRMCMHVWAQMLLKIESVSSRAQRFDMIFLACHSNIEKEKRRLFFFELVRVTSINTMRRKGFRWAKRRSVGYSTRAMLSKFLDRWRDDADKKRISRQMCARSTHHGRRKKLQRCLKIWKNQVTDRTVKQKNENIFNQKVREYILILQRRVTLEWREVISFIGLWRRLKSNAICKCTRLLKLRFVLAWKGTAMSNLKDTQVLNVLRNHRKGSCKRINLLVWRWLIDVRKTCLGHLLREWRRLVVLGLKLHLRSIRRRQQHTAVYFRLWEDELLELATAKRRENMLDRLQGSKQRRVCIVFKRIYLLAWRLRIREICACRAASVSILKLLSKRALSMKLQDNLSAWKEFLAGRKYCKRLKFIFSRVDSKTVLILHKRALRAWNGISAESTSAASHAESNTRRKLEALSFRAWSEISIQHKVRRHLCLIFDRNYERRCKVDVFNGWREIGIKERDLLRRVQLESVASERNLRAEMERCQRFLQRYNRRRYERRISTAFLGWHVYCVNRKHLLAVDRMFFKYHSNQMSYLKKHVFWGWVQQRRFSVKMRYWCGERMCKQILSQVFMHWQHQIAFVKFLRLACSRCMRRCLVNCASRALQELRRQAKFQRISQQVIVRAAHRGRQKSLRHALRMWGRCVLRTKHGHRLDGMVTAHEERVRHSDTFVCFMTWARVAHLRQVNSKKLAVARKRRPRFCCLAIFKTWLRTVLIQRKFTISSQRRKFAHKLCCVRLWCRVVGAIRRLRVRIDRFVARKEVRQGVVVFRGWRARRDCVESVVQCVHAHQLTGSSYHLRKKVLVWFMHTREHVQLRNALLSTVIRHSCAKCVGHCLRRWCDFTKACQLQGAIDSLISAKAESRVWKVDLILDMSMSEIAGKEDDFKRDVALDVAHAIGGDVSKVYVLALEPGSVVVKIGLAEGICSNGQSPLEVARELERQAANPHSLLKSGKLTNQTTDVLVTVVPHSHTEMGVCSSCVYASRNKINEITRLSAELEKLRVEKKDQSLELIRTISGLKDQVSLYEQAHNSAEMYIQMLSKDVVDVHREMESVKIRLTERLAEVMANELEYFSLMMENDLTKTAAYEEIVHEREAEYAEALEVAKVAVKKYETEHLLKVQEFRRLEAALELQMLEKTQYFEQELTLREQVESDLRAELQAAKSDPTDLMHRVLQLARDLQEIKMEIDRMDRQTDLESVIATRQTELKDLIEGQQRAGLSLKTEEAKYDPKASKDALAKAEAALSALEQDRASLMERLQDIASQPASPDKSKDMERAARDLQLAEVEERIEALIQQRSTAAKEKNEQDCQILRLRAEVDTHKERCVKKVAALEEIGRELQATRDARQCAEEELARVRGDAEEKLASVKASHCAQVCELSYATEAVLSALEELRARLMERLEDMASQPASLDKSDDMELAARGGIERELQAAKEGRKCAEEELARVRVDAEEKLESVKASHRTQVLELSAPLISVQQSLRESAANAKTLQSVVIALEEAHAVVLGEKDRLEMDMKVARDDLRASKDALARAEAALGALEQDRASLIERLEDMASQPASPTKRKDMEPAVREEIERKLQIVHQTLAEQKGRQAELEGVIERQTKEHEIDQERMMARQSELVAVIERHTKEHALDQERMKIRHLEYVIERQAKEHELDQERMKIHLLEDVIEKHAKEHEMDEERMMGRQSELEAVIERQAKEHALDQQRMKIHQDELQVEIERQAQSWAEQLWAVHAEQLVRNGDTEQLRAACAEQLALKESAYAELLALKEDAELRCRVLQVKVEETGKRWARKVSEMQDERDKIAVEAAEQEVVLASKQDELLKLQHAVQETVIRMEDAELRCRVLQVKVEETGKRWERKVSEMQDERDKIAVEAAEKEVVLASKQDELLKLQHAFQETVIRMEDAELRCRVLQVKVEETGKRWAEKCAENHIALLEANVDHLEAETLLREAETLDGLNRQNSELTSAVGASPETDFSTLLQTVQVGNAREAEAALGVSAELDFSALLQPEQVEKVKFRRTEELSNVMDLKFDAQFSTDEERMVFAISQRDRLAKMLGIPAACIEIEDVKPGSPITMVRLNIKKSDAAGVTGRIPDAHTLVALLDVEARAEARVKSAEEAKTKAEAKAQEAGSKASGLEMGLAETEGELKKLRDSNLWMQDMLRNFDVLHKQSQSLQLHLQQQVEALERERGYKEVEVMDLQSLVETLHRDRHTLHQKLQHEIKALESTSQHKVEALERANEQEVKKKDLTIREMQKEIESLQHLLSEQTSARQLQVFMNVQETEDQMRQCVELLQARHMQQTETMKLQFSAEVETLCNRHATQVEKLQQEWEAERKTLKEALADVTLVVEGMKRSEAQHSSELITVHEELANTRNILSEQKGPQQLLQQSEDPLHVVKVKEAAFNQALSMTPGPNQMELDNLKQALADALKDYADLKKKLELADPSPHAKEVGKQQYEISQVENLQRAGQSDRDSLQQKLQHEGELEAVRTQHSKEVAKLQQEIERLRNLNVEGVKTLEEHIKRFDEHLKDMQRQHETLNIEKDKEVKKLQDRQQKNEALQREKESLVQEWESERKTLEEDMKKKDVKLQDREKQIATLQREKESLVQEWESERKTLEEDMKQKDIKLQGRDKQIETLQREKASLVQEWESERKTLEEDMKKKDVKLQDREKQIATLQSELESLVQEWESERKTLEEDMKQKDVKLQDREKQIEKLQREKARLVQEWESERKTLEEDMKKKDTNLQDREKQFETLQREKESLVQEWESERKTLEEDMKQKDMKLQDREKQIEKLQREKASLVQEWESERKNLEEDMKQKDMNLQDREKQFETLQREKESLVQEWESERKTLEEDMKKKDMRLQDREKQIETLQREKESLVQEWESERKNVEEDMKKKDVKLQDREKQVETLHREKESLVQEWESERKTLDEDMKNIREVLKRLQTQHETELEEERKTFAKDTERLQTQHVNELTELQEELVSIRRISSEQSSARQFQLARQTDDMMTELKDLQEELMSIRSVASEQLYAAVQQTEDMMQVRFLSELESLCDLHSQDIEKHVEAAVTLKDEKDSLQQTLRHEIEALQREKDSMHKTLQHEIETLQRARRIGLEKIELHSKDIEKLQHEISTLQGSMTVMQDSHRDEVESLLDTLKEARSDILKIEREQEEQEDQHQKQIAQMEHELQSQKALCARDSIEMDKMEREIDTPNTTIEIQGEKQKGILIQEIQLELESLKRETRWKQAEIEHLQSHLERETEKVLEKDKEFKTLQREKTSLQQVWESEQTRHKEEVETLLEILKEVRSDMLRIESERDAQVDEMQREIDTLTKAIAKFPQELDGIRFQHVKQIQLYRAVQQNRENTIETLTKQSSEMDLQASQQVETVLTQNSKEVARLKLEIERRQRDSDFLQQELEAKHANELAELHEELTNIRNIAAQQTEALNARHIEQTELLQAQRNTQHLDETTRLQNEINSLHEANKALVMSLHEQLALMRNVAGVQTGAGQVQLYRTVQETEYQMQQYGQPLRARHVNQTEKRHVDGAQHPTSRQRVLGGAHLQEWTHDKHTGAPLCCDVFVQVTPNGEILSNNRRCIIKRVRDGFSKALSLAKPAETNSRCGFTVRLESDERVSDVYDLELLASSEHEKTQWIAGIVEVLNNRASSRAPHYVCENSNSFPNGRGLGVLQTANGDQYMGEWESGFGEGTENGFVPLPHGLGVFVWRNGDMYRGEWDKGLRSGFGTLETNERDICQGKWEDDRMSGPGICLSSNRQKYVGTMLAGRRHGSGVVTQQDGTKNWVEYCAGVETSNGAFPHPRADLQAALVQVSNDAREAAKTAAGRAEAAQALVGPKGLSFPGSPITNITKSPCLSMTKHQFSLALADVSRAMQLQFSKELETVRAQHSKEVARLQQTLDSTLRDGQVLSGQNDRLRQEMQHEMQKLETLNSEMVQTLQTQHVDELSDVDAELAGIKKIAFEQIESLQHKHAEQILGLEQKVELGRTKCAGQASLIESLLEETKLLQQLQKETAAALAESEAKIDADLMDVEDSYAKHMGEMASQIGHALSRVQEVEESMLHLQSAVWRDALIHSRDTAVLQAKFANDLRTMDKRTAERFASAADKLTLILMRKRDFSEARAIWRWWRRLVAVEKKVRYFSHQLELRALKRAWWKWSHKLRKMKILNACCTRVVHATRMHSACTLKSFHFVSWQKVVARMPAQRKYSQVVGNELSALSWQRDQARQKYKMIGVEATFARLESARMLDTLIISLRDNASKSPSFRVSSAVPVEVGNEGGGEGECEFDGLARIRGLARTILSADELSDCELAGQAQRGGVGGGSPSPCSGGGLTGVGERSHAGRQSFMRDGTSLGGELGERGVEWVEGLEGLTNVIDEMARRGEGEFDYETLMALSHAFVV